MGLTSAFYAAVKEGNVRRVRIMMEDSLLVDPTFTEFEQMKKAAGDMAGLYDEHDGVALIEDRSRWNDDYMNSLKVQLIRNFSPARLDHLRDVIRQLHPATEQDWAGNSHQEASQADNMLIGVAGGAVCGAALGCAVAVLAETTVAIGAVVGAVVGAAVGAVVVSVSAIDGGATGNNSLSY